MTIQAYAWGIEQRLPAAPTPPAETAWREACCAFLGACFRGSTKERLDFLARDLWHARDAMEMKRP